MPSLTIFYKSNEMDASTVGNGVDDSCTKSIMDANSMSNANHSNFYRSYMMDVGLVSNASDDICKGAQFHSAMPGMTVTEV
jgi:hypothetical protein